MTGEQSKRAITISRQLGSQGCEIAHIAGEILGYQVVQREVVNEAARRAGAPEAALAAIDELGLLGFCPSPELCAAYRQAVEQVMHELVDQGRMIIIGRAGQFILAGLPDVLHVRIIAPARLRAERVANRHTLTLEKAIDLVSASDRFRKNYLKRFYNLNWADPEFYDLVINTARVDTGRAARLIVQAVSEPAPPLHLL
jgi:cytidylate kinase